MATVIKINYGKDIRRCPVPDSASWAELRARIEALFGLDLAELNVTYQDDDGDVVSITDDFGLEEAIRIAGLIKSTPGTSAVLRITIDKRPSPPASPSARANADALPSLDDLPDVNAVLGAIAREMPMLQPIVDRVKHRYAAARGEAAGASAPPSASADAQPSAAPFDLPASAMHQDPLGLGRAEASTSQASPPPPADASGAHPLHTCDVCEASPIVGVRFHSLVIPNYDLCARCLEREGDKQPGGKAAFAASFKPVPPPPLAAAGPAAMPWRARGCRGGGGGFGGGFGGGGGPFGAWPPGAWPGAGSMNGGGAACGRGGEWAERADRQRHAARFIRDVTVFDGTEVAPAARFTKIWRMRNEGEQAWPAGTRLAFCGGDQLDGGVFAQLEGDGHVAPGAEVDVAVDMRAPAALGRYVGYWRLVTPRGKKFGQRIWAQVTVVDPSQPPSVALAAPPATRVPFAHEHGAHDDQDDDAHAQPRDAPAGRVLDELAAVFAAGAKAAETKAAAAQAHAAEPKPAAAPSREPSREPKTPAPEWESWPLGTWVPNNAAPPSAAAAAAAAAAPPPPPLVRLLTFPVEVADGRRLAISWHVGAEAAAVARAFAAAHGLPVDDVEEIERFVRKAEALVQLQANLALKPAAPQGAKPPTPAAAEPVAAAAAEAVAPKPAAAAPVAADDAPAAAKPDERASAAAATTAAAAAAATARALVALRAMGFAQDEALLAEVVNNNGGDVLACVADLTALADWDTMLSDLEAMGFEDDQKNKAALVSSKGDVKSAVRQLVKSAQHTPAASGAPASK